MAWIASVRTRLRNGERAPDGDRRASDADPTRRQMERQLQGVERFSIGLLVILALAVAGFGTVARPDATKIGISGGWLFLYIVAVYVAVVSAAIVLGGLLGFVFGIPRFLRANGAATMPRDPAPGAVQAVAPEEARALRTFAGNTNLEEISDWLTKIIVGLGLTQATTIYNKLAGLAAKFRTEAMADAAGSEAFLVAVSLAALVGGFLFFYLETRTRITLLLTDADTAAGPSRVSPYAVDASKNAPLSGDGRLGSPQLPDLTAKQKEADRELLALPFESLRKPDEFAAWAAAQARARNLQAASRAIGEAVLRDPDNRDYLAMMGDIRLKLGNPKGAVEVYSELSAKRRDPDILRRELLAALYLPAPESFERALATADRLMQADPKAASDALVQIWLAAARGQQYTWLVQNSGTDADKQRVREAALAATQEVVRLSPEAGSPARELLANMLDPSRTASDNTDNDLYVFATDPDFRAVILGEAPRLPATPTMPTPRPSEVSTDRENAAPGETETDAPVGRLP